MIDITDKFRDALKLKSSWNKVLFLKLLESLGARVPSGRTDWEDGVENWGVVFNDEGLISYVCEPIPIAFLNKRFSDYLSPILDAFGVVHVDAQDLMAEFYRIDKAILEEIFVAVTDVVDYNRVCLGDIWYATVTMPVRRD